MCTHYKLLLVVAGIYRSANIAGCCLLLQVSVDAHMLQVVATDGYYVDPVEVDVISFLPGKQPYQTCVYAVHETSKGQFLFTAILRAVGLISS